LVNKNGIRTVEPGDYRLCLGGSQNAELSTTVKLSKRIVDPPYAHIPPQVMPGN
jgi:hypothetical protein